MFDDILKQAKEHLEKNSTTYDLPDVIEYASNHIYEIMSASEAKNVSKLNADNG